MEVVNRTREFIASGVRDRGKGAKPRDSPTNPGSSFRRPPLRGKEREEV